MKPCRAREMIKFLDAYAKGEAIQYQAPSGEWIDPPNPQCVDFEIHTQYRVKPAEPELPTPPKDIYVNVYGRAKDPLGSAQLSAAKAKEIALPGHYPQTLAHYVLGTEYEALNAKCNDLRHFVRSLVSGMPGYTDIDNLRFEADFILDKYEHEGESA